MEFAQTVWGKRFQVVVTTHLNTKHLHCHFVDPKKLKEEAERWHKFQADVERQFLRPDKCDMKWQ